MTWDYWICLYTQTHCVARGLRPATIAAYQATLRQFRAYVQVRLEDAVAGPGHGPRRAGVPGAPAARAEQRRLGGQPSGDDPEELLPGDRGDGASGAAANPMAHFPRMKAGPRKLPVVLSERGGASICWISPPTDTSWGCATGRS